MQKIASVLLLCLITVLGCTLKDSSKRQNMGHIEVALPSFPKSIDPREVWSYYHYMLIQSLYSTLVRLNEEGELVAQLASRWTLSKDGKVIFITLDKGAVFHDSSPVTSEDVVYSLSRHLWPDSPSVLKGYLLEVIKGADSVKQGGNISGIVVKGKNELEIHLNNPYAPFLYLLSMPGLSIVKKDSPLIGSGPMIGKFDKSSETWRLRVSEQYFSKMPTVKSMNVHSVHGRSAIEESFKSSKIDVILGVPIGEVENLILPKQVIIRNADTLSFNHLFYNTNKALFKDKSFRRDFGLLIQRLAWKKKFLSAYQEKQATFIPKGVMPRSYYERPENNMTKEQFLKKWKSRIKSEDLKVILVRNHFKESFMNELEALLKDLGFKLSFSRAGSKEFIKVMKDKRYDIISGPYIGNFPDPDGFLEPLNAKSGLSFGSFNNVPFLEQLRSSRYIKDANERLESYAKVLSNLESEWSFIPLYRMNFPVIHHSKLKIPDSSYRYEAELWNIFWN